MSEDKITVGNINFGPLDENKLRTELAGLLSSDLSKFVGRKLVPEPGTVTRIEVIDPTGRVLVYYGEVELSFQDDGKTLKLFTKTNVNKG